MSKNNLSKLLTVRVSELHYKSMIEESRKRNTTLSDFIRMKTSTADKKNV